MAVPNKFPGLSNSKDDDILATAFNGLISELETRIRARGLNWTDSPLGSQCGILCLADRPTSVYLVPSDVLVVIVTATRQHRQLNIHFEGHIS